jgi:RimJ/RimL family protein N-acetyltransferase
MCPARGPENRPFVPADFVVPRRLETPQFRLEPLGPARNEADYRAWSSSQEHIHATPGWEESSWPWDMTLDDNRADLQRHADDFERRSGFTYTVLDPGGDVVGCVYIYPIDDDAHDARVLSWMSATHADLDRPLRQAVRDWLATEWPFHNVDYALREES